MKKFIFLVLLLPLVAKSQFFPIIKSDSNQQVYVWTPRPRPIVRTDSAGKKYYKAILQVCDTSEFNLDDNRYHTVLTATIPNGTSKATNGFHLIWWQFAWCSEQSYNRIRVFFDENLKPLSKALYIWDHQILYQTVLE